MATTLVKKRNSHFQQITIHLLDSDLSDSMSQRNFQLLKNDSLRISSELIDENNASSFVEDQLEKLEEQTEENFYSMLERQEARNTSQPSLQVGIQYNSQITYRGRILDTSGKGGGTIFIQYKLPIGLTFLANEYYWPGAERAFTKTDIGVEFEKYITKRFSLLAGYERWFFNVSEYIPRHQLTNFTELSLTYEFDWFSVYLGNYFMFGTETSTQIDFELSSYYEWYHKLGADKIFIEPTYKATWGTQFFSVGYFSTNPNPENSFFGIMSHELSLKATYQLKQIQVSPTVYYVHPVNGTLEDPIHNFAYFSLGVTYNLRFPRK